MQPLVGAALEGAFNGLAGQAAYSANAHCSTHIGSRTIFLNTTRAECSCATKHRLVDSRRALPVDIAAVEVCKAAADHVQKISWVKLKAKEKIVAKPGRVYGMIFA